MNDSLSKREFCIPNYPLFISNLNSFTSSKLKPLKQSIEKNEIDKFKEEFSICFQPIIKYLTEKDTIKKLSKNLKLIH